VTAPLALPRATGPAALVVVVVATGLGVAVPHPGHAPARLALVVVAYGAFALLLSRQRRRPFLTRRLVLAAVVPLLAVAVALPPRGSRDVWSYTMYGRAVSVHHRSPYRVDPDDLGSDPLVTRVAPRWRELPSVYGPAFVAVAAGVTAVARSATAVRVGFQLLAALAALGCVLLVGQLTGDAGAMAWLGLNPLLTLYVVNGGHNDLLVGAAALVGIAAARRRPVVAGVVVAVGALVKVVGLLALAALAVAVGRRRGLRSAAGLAGAGLAVVIAGFLAAGGSVALAPLRAAARLHAAGSVASALLAVDHHLHAVVLGEALVLAAVGALLLRPRLETWWLVAAVLTVYLLGAPYVMPWYVAWALPAAALGWRSRLATLVALQSAVLAVISVNSTAIDPAALHHGLSVVTHWMVPPLEAAALAVLVGTAWVERSAGFRPLPAPVPAGATIQVERRGVETKVHDKEV
jgi:hypothetical protein